MTDTKEPDDSDDFQNQKGRWDFRWNSGRKNALCFAVWILALGALYLLTKIYAWDLSLWNIAWPTALICWGVFGIFPRFSFFPLGCMILGLYFLIRQINPTLIPLGGELLIPSLLILWGLSLLVSALRKSKHSSGSIYWNGKSISPGRKSRSKTDFKFHNTEFKWDGCFCEDKQLITMDLLSHGKADISFGEFELDLSGVKKLTPDCLINANCSFGSMRILVPSQFKVECQRSNSFASIHCKATPAPDAVQTLYINADASFGEIVIETV